MGSHFRAAIAAAWCCAVASTAREYVRDAALTIDYDGVAVSLNYEGWVDLDDPIAPAELSPEMLSSVCGAVAARDPKCAARIRPMVMAEIARAATARAAAARDRRVARDLELLVGDASLDGSRTLRRALAVRGGADRVALFGGGAANAGAAALAAFGGVAVAFATGCPAGVVRFYRGRATCGVPENATLVFVTDCAGVDAAAIAALAARGAAVAADGADACAARLPTGPDVYRDAALVFAPPRAKQRAEARAYVTGGGAWTAEGHLGAEHGLNFDEPLAAFVAALRPRNLFEFGSGLGMYVDYACRCGADAAVGVEPGDMHGFDGAIAASACASYVALDASAPGGPAALRRALAGAYDVCLTVEVFEHVRADAHGPLLDVFRDVCAGYLVFSASSDVNDQGHVAPRPQGEWRALVEARGFRYLDATTAWLRARLPPRNVAHRANVMVFAAAGTTIADGDRPEAHLPFPPVDGGEEARAAALWPGLAAAARRV